jgi:GT2 family glycosyltransferase
VSGKLERIAGGQQVEIIVIEDGCRDATPRFSKISRARNGARGICGAFTKVVFTSSAARIEDSAPLERDLVVAWQDDMFVRRKWLVSELVATFQKYDELGLLCLSRGLNCHPLDEPIVTWNDLIDGRRLRARSVRRRSTGSALEEVDAVIRPWIVRKPFLEAVGYLDEAFVPTEWDEADLCFRIRQAGWKVATHGYERVGAYSHLGSTTISRGFTESYKQRVLRNGRLFHERWDDVIRYQAARQRRRWWRRTSAAGWLSAAAQAGLAMRRLLS